MNIKTIFIVLAALVLLGGGYFFYSLKPAEVTQDAAERAEELEDVEENFAVYRISQDESKVSFMVDEVLRGEDKTAIGETNQVAGDISVSLTDQTQGSIGEIVVNARALRTDSERRDGAIARFILKSEQDANQFVTFKPTSHKALSVGTTSAAEMSRYELTGDLTIAGVTRSVTFNIAVQSITAEKIIASAETVVKRSDFGITIPSVEFVASVDDEVTLKADIVANRVQ